MRNRSWATFSPESPADGSIPEPAGLLTRGLGSLFAAFLLGLIGIYRRMISPLLGPTCRFHPTCSSYATEAIVRHGPILGTARALGRLARCHPLSEGGYDPVP